MRTEAPEMFVVADANNVRPRTVSPERWNTWITQLEALTETILKKLSVDMPINETSTNGGDGKAGAKVKVTCPFEPVVPVAITVRGATASSPGSPLRLSSHSESGPVKPSISASW